MLGSFLRRVQYNILTYPRRCDCLPGHWDANAALAGTRDHQLDCRPIDVCVEGLPGHEMVTCSQANSSCVTTGPGTYTCICDQGFEDDGDGGCRRMRANDCDGAMVAVIIFSSSSCV